MTPLSFARLHERGRAILAWEAAGGSVDRLATLARRVAAGRCTLAGPPAGAGGAYGGRRRAEGGTVTDTTDTRQTERRADGQGAPAGEGRLRLEHEFHTAKEAGQILGLTPNQLQPLLFRGILPSLRRTEGVPDASPWPPNAYGR